VELILEKIVNTIAQGLSGYNAKKMAGVDLNHEQNNNSN